MKKIATIIAALTFGVAANVAFAADTPPPDGEHKHGDHTKPHDCTKAPADHKARCEARNKALEVCKDKKGEDHKKCMMDQRPKKDK